MRCVPRAAASFLLGVHLLCVHFLLFCLWYRTGLRKSFVRVQNIHVKDLDLAITLAGAHQAEEVGAGSVRPACSNRLALLFMVRTHIHHLDAWRRWLASAGASDSVSLYFHVADGLEKADAPGLMSLPGARRIIPTVATGWCELMAAEVALVQSALADDPSAQLFVLLPHDAVPLVPLDVVLHRLLKDTRSRVCLAGVRGLEVSVGCAHAIEPHWNRALLLKHHQWIVLSRAHAERLSNVRALSRAVSLFESNFLGEPLCSDEVLPLLALALPDTFNSSDEIRFNELMLFNRALNLHSFEQGLRELDVLPECVLFAPWPGCYAGLSVDKRAKSPSLRTLGAHDREMLVGDLVTRGVLFGRRLDLADDALERLATTSTRRSESGPSRLLIEGHDVKWMVTVGLFRWLLWGFATLEVSTSVVTQITCFTSLALMFGWGSLRLGAISSKALHRLLCVYSIVHVVIFFASIALHAEYSFMEPFRARTNRSEI